MVLRAAAAGEYDRRITLLTRERGKITAFARGARKPGSALIAATVPFAFGRFRVYEGKSAYTCVAAEVRNYFETLKTDFIGACYGAYFMEFADYYAQENLDGTDMLNLLYVSLLALEKDAVPDELVRCAFEVRLMVQVLGTIFSVILNVADCLFRL
jgi:DNA repair protein RecO (recombination protein O)